MRVLLVDKDSQRVRSHLKLISDFGYEVIFCPVGTDAMETVERSRPHVIMLNLVLTDFDGFDLVARLRRDPQLCPRLLIACTGQETEHRRGEMVTEYLDHHSREAQGGEFLRKMLQDCEQAMRMPRAPRRGVSSAVQRPPPS